MWLSPEARLLADASAGAEDVVYDGCGHRIVLPRDVGPDDPLPLIVVGAGKTLLLRNVRLVHASSLPACLQLAPGMCCAHHCPPPLQKCLAVAENQAEVAAPSFPAHSDKG